jgi:PKD repeat protein
MWEITFDFDDGTFIKERLNSIVQHKFEKVGKYEVSLMLLDVDGISSYKDFVTIEVLPRPKPIILPVARFTISPSTGDVNTDFLFDTSDSTTGPGTTIVDYDWWFGDNITSAYESPIHRYSDDGVYTIKLKITDSQGQFSEVYQQTLIVYNLAPSILLSVDKNRVLVGEEVTFNASSTFDFDDTLTEPLTRLIWDFGDNSSYSESPIKYPDGKFDKITTHVYSEPGNYIISVEIFDDDGESNKTSINITVIALDTPEKDDSEPLIFNHGFIIAMIILFCLLILIVFIVFYNRRNRYHPQDKDYKAYEEGAGARAEGYEYYPDYGEGGAKAEYGISAAIGAADVGKKKKGAKRDSTKAKKHVSSSKPSPRKSRIESIRPVVVDVEVPEEKVVDWRDEASAVNHTLTMSDIQVVTNGDLSDASIIRMEDEPEEEFEEIFDVDDAELQGLEPEPELEFEEEFEEEFDELEEEPEFEPVELELEAETEQELETTEGVTFEEVFDEQAEIEEEGLEGEPEVEPEAGAEEDEEETLVFEFDDEGEHITTELHPTHEDSATEKRVKHKKGERLIPIPGVGFVTKDELKSAMGEKLDERPYSGSTPTPEVVRYDEDGFGLRCKTCLRPIRGKFIKIRRKGEDTDGKQFVPIGPFCSPECAARFEKQW